jgi:hypothetical protein
MALTKSILKLTETEAVVKVAGNGGTATIDIQADILDSNQAISGATQTVNITGVRWGGENANVIAVSRNSTRVLTLPTEQADMISFDGQELPSENTANTFDIEVAQTGTGYVELYLKLRKVSGYAPKVEDAEFGSYDNTTTVGS